MHAFVRLSAGPTLPGLDRTAACADAAWIAAVMRGAVRRSARTGRAFARQRLASLAGRDAAPHADQPGGRTMLAMAEVQAWTMAAEMVLAMTRLCHRAGLLDPDGIGAGFRAAAWLTSQGMRAWWRTSPGQRPRAPRH